jgi:acid phosphatase (class A)
MTNSTRRLLLALALAWAVPILGPLQAGPEMPGSGKESRLHYLSGRENVWSGFAKAPAPGSPADLSDLAIILAVQSTRTPDQIAEARRDEHYSIKLLTDVVDPAFEKTYPKTFAVLLRANQDEGVINVLLKREYARPRPYVAHPILVTPLFPAGDFSYPSGHSSGAELQADLLGRLFPAKAGELLRRARQVADSRVVAGVHYASDTAEGLVLGDLVFKELEENPQFESDFRAAAKEDGINLP